MGTFADRHIGPDADEQAALLDAVGYPSLDALVDAAVPAAIRDREPLALGGPVSEEEVLARLHALGSRNDVYTSLIGLGYHDTFTPPVILRNVVENPAWYTAYTPYQPEISQGRLEVLLNFQTMVSDLTGMDLSNASLLDEATAAAEAMTMLHRVNPKAGTRFVVDADCHPQTIAVVRKTREIGLRAALGAHPRHVLLGILSRAAVLMGSGVVTGAVVVLFIAWLWEEDIAQIVLWLAVTAAVMLGTGLLASLGPARRALSISPTDALKEV